MWWASATFAQRDWRTLPCELPIGAKFEVRTYMVIATDSLLTGTRGSALQPLFSNIFNLPVVIAEGVWRIGRGASLEHVNLHPAEFLRFLFVNVKLH